jgi:recombination protein RecR
VIYPPSITRLVEELGRLPGVGPKSAQRMAFHLLRADRPSVERLAAAMLEARTRVSPCVECGFFAEGEGALCSICRDGRRDRGILCVVEDAKDVAALEATHEYRGVYHVLGRALSPIDGIGPEALRLELLARRLDAGEVREVILATDPDVEGEATAMYLSHWLSGRSVRVTRIARGLPMGGDLDYADALTLIRALEGRQDMGGEAPGLRA